MVQAGGTIATRGGYPRDGAEPQATLDSGAQGTDTEAHARGGPCPYFLVGARLYARLAQQGLLYSTKRDCRPPMSGSLATARRASRGARSQTSRAGSQTTGAHTWKGALAHGSRAWPHGWTWSMLLETGSTLVRMESRVSRLTILPYAALTVYARVWIILLAAVLSVVHEHCNCSCLSTRPVPRYGHRWHADGPQSPLRHPRTTAAGSA